MKTLDGFCKEFRTNLPELAGFTAEPDFLKRVLECKEPWVKLTTQVLEAVLKNAKDAGRADQGKWVAAYMGIVDHPGAEVVDSIFCRHD